MNNNERQTVLCMEFGQRIPRRLSKRRFYCIHTIVVHRILIPNIMNMMSFISIAEC